MNALVWAAVGVVGGFGAVARFTVDRAVARRTIGPFPFGTLVVNLTGAVLLGFFGALALSPHTALIVGTGFVGAYTTFSTWMFETHRLAEERQFWPAAANIVVSVVLGVAAAALGTWLGGALR
jgi:fluoride exporter